MGLLAISVTAVRSLTCSQNEKCSCIKKMERDHTVLFEELSRCSLLGALVTEYVRILTAS